MRQVLFGVIIISILTNCSEKENLTLDQEIQTLGDPSQIFTITSDKTDTIQAKNGTRLIIRSNTFVFNDGQDATDSIQIELKEVFDKSDMILNGLGTVSDGRLIESFGMIFLRATSNGKELRIKDNSSITVSIPNKKSGYDGELFYGIQTDSLLNWDYGGTTKDTIEIVETRVPLSDGLESIKRTTYKYVSGMREFVSDTLFTRKNQNIYEYAADSVAARPRESYQFGLTNLGWINCDRFIEIKEKVDLEIEIENYSQPIGYLVFADINSVMQVLFNSKGKAAVKNLPKNYQADLVVLDKIKGNVMWTKQSLKIGAESKLTLETRKISTDELKIELERLDK